MEEGTMLLRLRDYIVREGMVSTQQMTREFKIEPSALQPMLDLWVNKGVIQKATQGTCRSQSCNKCHSNEYYLPNLS
jgi:hypothetical protein